METIRLDCNEEWNKRVEMFHHPVVKLACFSNFLSSKDKAWELTENLLEKFKSTLMLADSSGVSFKRVKASIQPRFLDIRSKGGPKMYFMSPLPSST